MKVCNCALIISNFLKVRVKLDASVMSETDLEQMYSRLLIIVN
jgi:hypothetical protein